MTLAMLMKVMNDRLALLSSDIIGVMPSAFSHHVACSLYLTIAAQDTASSLRTLCVLKVQKFCAVIRCKHLLRRAVPTAVWSTRPGTQQTIESCHCCVFFTGSSSAKNFTPQILFANDGRWWRG